MSQWLFTIIVFVGCLAPTPIAIGANPPTPGSNDSAKNIEPLKILKKLYDYFGLKKDLLPPAPNQSAKADAENKISEEKKLRQECAKRLGIDQPPEKMKLETVKSEKYPEEEYDLAIDEAEAKRLGILPEELKKSLMEAMDSRGNRNEDSQLDIEIEKEEVIEADDETSKPEKKVTTKAVARIKKKDRPSNPINDSKQPAEKKFKIDYDKHLKFKAGGACPSQNQGLLEALRLSSPT